jgi:hypothetical protein
MVSVLVAFQIQEIPDLTIKKKKVWGEDWLPHRI